MCACLYIRTCRSQITRRCGIRGGRTMCNRWTRNMFTHPTRQRAQRWQCAPTQHTCYHHQPGQLPLSPPPPQTPLTRHLALPRRSRFRSPYRLLYRSPLLLLLLMQAMHLALLPVLLRARCHLLPRIRLLLRLHHAPHAPRALQKSLCAAGFRIYSRPLPPPPAGEVLRALAVALQLRHAYLPRAYLLLPAPLTPDPPPPSPPPRLPRAVSVGPE